MVNDDKHQAFRPIEGMTEPVLILTPTGRDAPVITARLHDMGMRTQICHNMADFCAGLGSATAGLIASEALSVSAVGQMTRVLMRQPAWSDIPLVVLIGRNRGNLSIRQSWQSLQQLVDIGNVTLLERPLRRITLLTALNSAFRQRQRQYRMRQLYEELDQRIARQSALLARLNKSEEALQQMTRTLEQQVAVRTAELEQQTHRLRKEIFERQRMQEALHQQEKLAALGTLLANVAHELNNPLAVATMQLDNLQEETDSLLRAEELEALRQAIERCKSVAQSFLSLARQPAATHRAVALKAVIGEVLVLLGRSLNTDGITLYCRYDEQLPPVWADANQLHHVVANLITNAQHALQQISSPRVLKLSTAASADRSRVILQVEDNGTGIPQAIQSRIFDPFFTTKPQGVGSGLGLPLCRNIVEAHGGTLHLASQCGQGTTVRVTLPVADSDIPAPEPVSESDDGTQAPGRTILIIDDEPAVQKALQRVLQRSGYDVTTANNGLEGLEALEKRTFDAILCDLRMPGLDGPGFFRELESWYPHLLSRIVFLTGDTLSPEAQHFFAQIKCPRLIKPFNAQKVRQALQHLLAHG